MTAFNRLNWGDHAGRHLEGLGVAKKPFNMPGDKPHYARDKQFELHHIRIDVSLDFATKAVRGTSSITLSSTLGGLSRVDLDAVELTILGARLATGRELEFEVHDEMVGITFPGPLAPAELVTVIVDYQGTPRKGLYFVGPDDAYPDKPVQAWTQGEDQDSRYWVPCYDFPNQRATSEVIATVPEDMFALSNGRLVDTNHEVSSGTKSYHWRQDEPHVSYLITLAAGSYVELNDGDGEIPIQYYVPAGREEDARRAFGKTPAMMRLFTELTGASYPWAKYAQIAVADFIFGGMENTSATTLTDSTLHDERAHIDFSSDFLVSHELAHQWFGDLITCRDWSHAWLNEGFATYFEALFTEHDLGVDEFRYELYRNASIYLAEASGHYQRPLVTRVYNEPIDLFDRHLYEKGSLVLHMLRYQLGDALFFLAIRRYVQSHSNDVVSTEDLREAIEEVTGRTMESFFDQWVYKGGHPDLKVAHVWDDDSSSSTLTVTQRQDTQESCLFTLPVEIDFQVSGIRKSFKVELTDREQRFHFPLDGKPEMVRFDPGNHFLKVLEEDFSKELHFTRLKQDDDVVGRVRAVTALGKLGSNEAIDALKEAVLEDRFWGVQAEAAIALGTIKSNGARDALLQAMSVSHPKARRAVIGALGNVREESVGKALAGVLATGDASYFVEAEAARSLGKTRSSMAYEALVKALDKDSHQDVIRAAVMDGLAELRDERGLEIARAWAAYGRPQPVRPFAIGAAAKLGEDHKDTIDFLSDLLYDGWLRVRLSVLTAFETLGSGKALGPLTTMIDREQDGRVKRRARQVVASIREGLKGKEEVRNLQQEMERLSDQNRTLTDRLDKLESNI